MFVKPIEDFLEAFEKKFQSKKWGVVRIFQLDFDLHFILIFWAETFFKKASRKFSVELKNMFKVSEKSA